MFVEEEYPSPSAGLVISLEDVFKQKPTPIPLRLPIQPQGQVIVASEPDDTVVILAISLVALFGLFGFLAYLASRRS